VEGLFPLAPDPSNYDLVGSTNQHPVNHNGVLSLNQALVAISSEYATRYSGDKLQYNDMSLLFGGVFDIEANWHSPHSEHALGLNVDLCMIPGTSCTRLVPADRRTALLEMIRAKNTGVLVEKPPLAPYHWHLRYGEPGCEILGQPDTKCNKDNIGPNSLEFSNSTAANYVQVHSTVLVTYDALNHLYNYQYSFTNETSSLLEISNIQIPLKGLAVMNVHAPEGWTVKVWKDNAAIAFAATEIPVLPPNYVDEGNLVPSPFQIKAGYSLAGFSFQSPNPPGTTVFFAQGFKPIPEIVNQGPQPSMFEGGFRGGTTGPVAGGPILISEETSTRAIALGSPLWIKAPFQVDSPVPWGADRRTRVMLFAMNFDLLPLESNSVVTADAEDAFHVIYPLTVEYVGKVPGYNWLNCVIVKLNDSIGDAGDVLVRLNVRGVPSNRVRLAVGHAGGGPPDDIGAVPTPGTAPF
jgi:hypothetical protein